MKHFNGISFVGGILLASQLVVAQVYTDYSFVYGSSNHLYRWNSEKHCGINEETGSCDLDPLTSYYLYSVLGKEVRIRVIGQTPNAQGKVQIQRPFLIIDGINLNPTEKSLEKFEEEIEELNIPKGKPSELNFIPAAGNILGGLQSAGYTPILVQFAYTTRNGLNRNAALFSLLLKHLSQLPSQSPLVWSNSTEQGFVVLGISQGGVLGRYGSYLYDRNRASDQAPIRLFASLDSPHQGAVVPRGVIATVDFWGRERSKAAAKEFLDILQTPGASELLIYQTTAETEFAPNTSRDRWLYGEYRAATSYNGFPVVLLSNGQLDGQKNSPTTTDAYKLNRWAEKGTGVWGRAVSEISQSSEEDGQYAYNREYNFGDDVNADKSRKGKTQYDLVQGSIYPFFGELYESFEEAFLKEIPYVKEHCYGICVDIYGKWDAHEIHTKEATFIPTTSSLDLLCDGALSVNKDCMQTQTTAGISWENPGSRTSAKAIYAVDETHPGSVAANSGRHVTGATATVDLWRLFCEVAKADWDEGQGERGVFRNPNLNGKFDPHAVCMDQQAISPWFNEMVAPTEFEQKESFPWVRWSYNSKKIDQQFPVAMTLPAGWNVVSTMDKGATFGTCDVIQVTLNTNTNFTGNWLRAELVLSTTKNGSGWWQLGEQIVPVDGASHTVTWQLPCNETALRGYRWAKLVLNSLGGGVTVSKVQITNSTMGAQPPPELTNSWIVPENKGLWRLGSWGTHDRNFYDETFGDGIQLNMPNVDNGAYFQADNYWDLKRYTQLRVRYWPNTCQHTWLYFDRKTFKASLAGGVIKASLMEKTIPLSSLIDTRVTPLNTMSAQRLYAQTSAANETCIIKEIQFQ